MDICILKVFLSSSPQYSIVPLSPFSSTLKTSNIKNDDYLIIFNRYKTYILNEHVLCNFSKFFQTLAKLMKKCQLSGIMKLQPTALKP